MSYHIKHFIGIDPGTTGAIAFLDTEWKSFSLPMKKVSSKSKGFQKNELDFEELDRIVANYLPHPGISVVYLEKVSTRSGQGISSSGVLMRLFGQLEGFFNGLGYEVKLVSPTVWTKELGIKSNNKTGSKDYLKRVYGFEKRINHNRADACCIAEYGIITSNK